MASTTVGGCSASSSLVDCGYSSIGEWSVDVVADLEEGGEDDEDDEDDRNSGDGANRWRGRLRGGVPAPAASACGSRRFSWRLGEATLLYGRFWPAVEATRALTAGGASSAEEVDDCCEKRSFSRKGGHFKYHIRTHTSRTVGEDDVDAADAGETPPPPPVAVFEYTRNTCCCSLGAADVDELGMGSVAPSVGSIATHLSHW